MLRNMEDRSANQDADFHKLNLTEKFFEPIDPDNDQMNTPSKLYNANVIRKSISENKLENLANFNPPQKAPLSKTCTLDARGEKKLSSKTNILDEKIKSTQEKSSKKASVRTNSVKSSAKSKGNEKDKEFINKYLPQPKFGLGPDHADTILLVIRYFRIVLMVYGVWLIGKERLI